MTPEPQVSTRRARRRWAVVGLVAAVVAALALVVVPTGAEPPEAGTARAAPAPVERDAPLPPRLTAPRQAVDPAVLPPSESGETVPGSAHFEMRSVYPPRSRPLSRERNPDLIAWNTPETVWLPVSGGPLEIALTTDVASLVGDRPLAVTLEARGAADPDALEVTRAQVRLKARRGAPLPAGTEAPVDLTLVRAGERWRGTLVPAALWQIDRQVSIELDVELRYGPARWQQVRTAVHYTPAAAVPARFTGKSRDVVENGSLVVYAGIEVMRPGWYVLDANLWTEDDEPVAWTRWKGELAAGSHEVRLEFFGKVLVDRARPAPWRVRDLRGFLYDAEASPGEVTVPPLEGELRTRAWRLDQLSDAEWSGPQRDAERAQWQQLEEEGQAPPIPAEAFDNDLEEVTP